MDKINLAKKISSGSGRNMRNIEEQILFSKNKGGFKLRLKKGSKDEFGSNSSSSCSKSGSNSKTPQMTSWNLNEQAS